MNPSDSSSQADGLSISARFFRFFLSGGVGFLIEAVVLTTLVKSFDFNIYLARAISFSLAVTVTWLLNRRYAFADLASARRGDEYSRYFAIQITGAVINLGIFAGLISAKPDLAQIPVVPLAVGAAIALFFNFGASRGFVFRGDGKKGI
ncbi:MAG: GtrA family protein [Gammaproteobacteria bacterium]